MIAVDTNILLRLIVQDDPIQIAVSDEILELARRDGEQIHVSDIVLCEIVWNLEQGYDFKKLEIIDAIDKIFRSDRVHFQSRDRIKNALEAFRVGRADFSDYLIREEAKEVGCRKLYSFDRDLLKFNGFVERGPKVRGNGSSA